MWRHRVRSLRADHVELINFCPWASGALPRANRILTIRYKNRSRATLTPGELLPAIDPDLFVGRLNAVFDGTIHLFEEEPFLLIDKLRLIGFIERVEDGPEGIEEEAGLDLLYRYMTQPCGVMDYRSSVGSRNSLKVAIMPDSSAKSEACAVWRTYEPYVNTS